MHRRASSWYTEQRLIEEALRHVLSAGDTPGAAKLVEVHFHWAREQEGWMQMERWLRILPDLQIQSIPCLLLARVWLVHSHGCLTDLLPLLAAVELLQTFSGNDVPDEANSLNRLLHAVSANSWCQFWYFTGRAQKSVESAQRALEGRHQMRSISQAWPSCTWHSLTRRLDRSRGAPIRAKGTLRPCDTTHGSPYQQARTTSTSSLSACSSRRGARRFRFRLPLDRHRQRSRSCGCSGLRQALSACQRICQG